MRDFVNRISGSVLRAKHASNLRGFIDGGNLEWNERRKFIPKLDARAIRERRIVGSYLLKRLPTYRASPLRLTTDDSYTNILGTSLVRGFTVSPSYFPLMIGTGRSTFLLDPETYEKALESYRSNALRLNQSLNLLVFLGGDPRFHRNNVFGTRSHSKASFCNADRKVLEAIALRYVEFIAELRKHYRGRVALVGAFPTFDALINEMTRHFNERLAELVDDFVDVGSITSDPDSGNFREDCSTDPATFDLHPSPTCVRLVTEAFRKRGLVAKTQGQDALGWRMAHSYALSEGPPVRIWPDSKLATASKRVAATQVIASAWHYLAPDILCEESPPSVLVLNAMDGGPVFLWPQGLGECLGVCFDAAEFRMGQRVAQYLGRDSLRLYAEGLKLDLPGPPTVLAVVHPETLARDLPMIQKVCREVQTGRVTVLADLAFQAQLKSAFGNATMLCDLAGKHLPESWNNMSLFCVKGETGT